MKDYTGNKNAALSIIGARNYALEDREEDDYYATNPKALSVLLNYETFSINIWECACGGGHLSEELKKNNYNVMSTDLIDRGYYDFKQFDFLQEKLINFKGDIITNPPYKYATEFVIKSLQRINKGSKVAMFLKLTFLSSIGRYNDIFTKVPPKIIYVFSN